MPEAGPPAGPAKPGLIDTARPLLLGCDFSSAPTVAKPIVVAWGQRAGAVVRLGGWRRFASLRDWAAAMAVTGDGITRIAAFDFPFGLPRELVAQLGWPSGWADCIGHYAGLDRAHIRALFKALCDARPAGRKFLHRRTEAAAGASPSMRWVNPPVAFMLHAGVPPLLAAGWSFPGLHAGHPQHIALEGYPGLLARELIGRRSYKADDRTRQTHDRLIARRDLLAALEAGRTRLGLRLKLSAAQHDALAQDASGDTLDAALCLLQAAWAERAGPPLWGLPADLDPLEGWIVATPPAAATADGC